MAEKNRLLLLVPQEKQPGQGCIPPFSPLLHGSGNSPDSSLENLTVTTAMDDMQRQPSIESLASSSSDEVVIEEAQEASDPTVVTVTVDVESQSGEQQPAQIKKEALAPHPRFRRERKISVRHPRRSKASDSAGLEKMEVVKEGYLMQQGRTFQRWAKKYLTITGDRLFITKTPEDKLQEEITLKGINIAENSTKNVNHSFTVLTPFQQVALAAGSRKEMEEWISAFKVAASKTKQAGVLEALQHLEGQHSWFTCSHARRTYCNVCREALHGVAWHGLSCEVCKFKSHRRCVFAAKQSCKWATRSNLDEAGVSVGPDFSIPHQWLEGNLPTGSKCIVCERACGSVRRLQDFKCMWCKWTVHTECLDRVTKTCTLGDHRLSILPPSALQRSNSIKKGMWEPNKVSGRSPVLALVNSKSGENLGVKFLRKLKYWLNPVQVFDLAISGPDLGLQLFQRFEKFRIIVMGGDGSVGWVLSAVDKLNLHSKCMLGVVPLGTGNDLARVMGWGARCDDEEKIPSILTDMEHSSFKLLDRWAIQYTEDKEVDMVPLLRQNSISAGSANKIPQSRSPVGSPPKPAQLQSLAPFPGPGTTLGQPAASPDPVFSPQDSLTSNSSDAENRSPSPLALHENSRTANNGTDSPDGRVTENGDDSGRQSKESSSSPDAKTNRFSGCSQTPQKVEVFHGSLAAHLSTILLSEDEKAVVASAQVLCGVVRDFISSVVADREQHLPAADFVNDPFVHRCTELHGKLKGLLVTLRNEAESVTSPSEEKNDVSEGKVYRPREALMTRANSLKKAVRAVFDMTEKVVDAQAETTAEIEALTRNGYGGPVGTELVSTRNGVKTGRPRPRRQKSDSTSSHGSVVDPAPLLLPETKELACMNNYFGIGVDAKITYQFNTTREKNPAQYKSRTKNMLLYATLGGKELFTNTQRHLERRMELECDGKVFQLPQRLQGLVFLNIPSYMAGTNFWGTKEEKEGFSAPSHDDKLLEVVGITGMTQVATSKVLGIQNRRITQCRVAKLTLNGSEKFPMQVDGEAWLQGPGTIIVSHKNKARLLVKDKAFTQSLESWKQKNPNSQSTTSLGSKATAAMPTVTEALTTEELDGFQKLAAVIKPLLACIKEEAAVSSEAARVLMPHVSTAMVSLERVFPNDQASETADVEHLQDFERDVKALLQETLWFLSVRRVSSEREQQMKEHSQATEDQMKVLLCGNSAYCSLAHHNLRRASDTFLTSARPRLSAAKTSVPPQVPTDAIPRARASQLVPEDAVSGPEAAERIGKDILDWDTDDVCRWLQEMQLQEYQPLMRSHSMTGSKLVECEKSDLKKLGITKLGALTRINHGLQSLTCSSLDTLLRSKRKNMGHSRDKTL